MEIFKKCTVIYCYISSQTCIYRTLSKQTYSKYSVCIGSIKFRFHTRFKLVENTSREKNLQQIPQICK